MHSLRDLFFEFIALIQNIDFETDELLTYRNSRMMPTTFELMSYGKQIGDLVRKMKNLCRERIDKYEDGLATIDLSVIADVCYLRVRKSVYYSPHYKLACAEQVKFAVESAEPYLRDEEKYNE